VSYIQNYINNINNRKRKVLSVFLTAGFPDPDKFITLAQNIFSAGADILEIGIPFSDPIADGPIIQQSSQVSLSNNTNLARTFHYCEKIKKDTKKPIILMGYSNPVMKYGIQRFIQDANNCGVDGLIIPDIPLEEYDEFWGNDNPEIDIILLTTPTSSDHRIQTIDQKSTGFVYCVSMTGTTGVRDKFDAIAIQNLNRTYKLIKKNKMLVGFGISSPKDITRFSSYCDGLIIGSAVIGDLIHLL
jgi:tryptophan synthase alpha chain